MKIGIPEKLGTLLFLIPSSSLLIPPVLLIPSSSSETCDSMAHKKATDKVHQAKKQAAAKANSKKNLVYTGFGHA